LEHDFAHLIFAPDPIARIQHEKVYGVQRGSADDQAVRALLRAVLEDAIGCFQGSNAKLVEEAEEWIDSDDEEVFSFNHICETLGLDPQAVRRGLKRWKAKQGETSPEKRARLVLKKGKWGRKKGKARRVGISSWR
jgi:hypothetical protein